MAVVDLASEALSTLTQGGQTLFVSCFLISHGAPSLHAIKPHLFPPVLAAQPPRLLEFVFF